MSKVEIFRDSVRSALADRVEQAQLLATSLRQIERAAEVIPEQIETSARDLGSLAESLARLIRDGEEQMAGRQQYLAEMDRRMAVQKIAMDEATMALRNAALAASVRTWSTPQLLVWTVAAAALSALASIGFLHLLGPALSGLGR